jgi:hypothetical protein
VGEESVAKEIPTETKSVLQNLQIQFAFLNFFNPKLVKLQKKKTTLTILIKMITVE